MTAFDNTSFDAHESVHHFFDRETQCRVVIAIHSTGLGPAAGGCRRWSYGSFDDAMTDALRLSRGMSYKNAMAGLPFGGGKAILLTEKNQLESAKVFGFFGECVESLNGKYVTAEDVGVSTQDMRHVSHSTRFVSGLPSSAGKVGGDPSPWTAQGVFLSIRAAVKKKFGVASLDGIRVAVQGVGNVGFHLCRLLSDAGASLTVADINAANVERLLGAVDAKHVDAESILYEDVDVLAPCALGATLNAESIPFIKAKVVAGAANNQLSCDQDGASLLDRGIVYVPDYVANAGGIISVAAEYLGDIDLKSLSAAVGRIPHRVTRILEVAEREAKPSNTVADEMAREILSASSDRSEKESVLNERAC